MKFICIKQKYGNFTKGKIYESYMIFAGIGKYKNTIKFVKITDDDSDG